MLNSRRIVIAAAVLGLASGCARLDSVVLGHVQATVAGYHVSVTDCYRTTIPEPERPSSLADGTQVYRWAPCRDAQIVIRGRTLVVNDREIQTLRPGDEILVDHGKVSVHSTPTLSSSR